MTLVSLVCSILFLISCSGTGLMPETRPYLEETLYTGLHAGERVPIKGNYLQGHKWSSSNYFVAEADESGYIVPKHVGSTEIVDAIAGRILVEVAPKITDYDMPIVYNKVGYNGIMLEQDLLLGRQVDMGSYEYANNRYLHSYNFTATTETFVFATSNKKTPYLVYYYDNKKLAYAASVFNPIYSSELPDLLKERYEVFSVDIKSYSAYFEHRKGKQGAESVDYIGGLQYSAQLGGILLLLMLDNKTKASTPIGQIEVATKLIEKELLQSSVLLQ